MTVHAFVFPGQGSQSVGMGLALNDAFGAAREVFQEVDDALGQKLSALMFQGDAGELTRTENAQPALMAVSMAVLRVLEREGGFRVQDKAALVAGHSLGEYSALAAAGSLGIAQTARLLRLRGQAMQKAVPAGEGGMAALIGVESDQARAICEEAAILRVEGQPDRHEVIEVANDNGGGQIVISGTTAAIARAVAIAKEKGVKRAVVLPVSAPFHCSLMAPAAEAMGEALERSEIARPVVPVVANVTAAKVSDPAEIRGLLVKQVTGTVRWRESVLAMAAMGVESVIELGAGKVLSGLVKRIDGSLAVANAGAPDEVEGVLKLLS
ncbi:ACP S-malonyltransferase [Acidomonas methanolica]|uniref:Malonyl CoA-acyl carrier protein transacylase n=1 Tax=Acidomonas methanolica NBRC 104435 TaxID=1231351 RepID=A0A023D3A2_ACIMT|nr:ACP S-malonyltransferase [Acidomonas methanolica]MBU2654446.1 ACP S-malonyltransferase [Acidomonas methanolica]TCS28249.1 [acyl-carrier-protein] S-malonyltransferase [Acidomonas methanolica]GAJ28617.1 malonyl-CoA-(acyl carrier protein) transacylase [Acidomonas methanolica NBRC 104435]GBQ52508.1 malonyl CoA-ACP transacylase [Acidomonas methanolica]GEK98966.1 malonyl CoA-acyl carrier protein transacylase [Acidomonas methanolica NBRC 104435]